MRDRSSEGEGMWRWWCQSTMSVLALLCASASLDVERAPCEEARIKCALREGCGMALQHYLIGCSAVLQAPSTHCPEVCQHSLIALTSTEEGRDLMNCQCSDPYCEESKRRVEICRASVLHANRNESIVSCTAAQWICAADTLCSTALDFYHRHCRSMFHGKKCTHRCRNSISILRRQEKAAKLKTCRCNGHEDYDCPRIQTNMARLCFHAKRTTTTTTAPSEVEVALGDPETNVIQRALETVSLATSLPQPPSAQSLSSCHNAALTMVLSISLFILLQRIT